MLVRILGIQDDPTAIFLALVCGGLFTYFACSGLAYLVFFRWGAARFHPNEVGDPAQDRRARRWGTASIVGNAALAVPFHWLLSHGAGQLYWDVDEHGWGWLFASIALYLVVTETLVYWVHRALHGDLLYRTLHRHHHGFRVSNPWVSTAFHPLDSFAQALPHHLCAFLFPLHALVYLTMLAFVTMWAVSIHDRISWARCKLINYTGHHTLHHWYYHCNFGQFTTIWDRLAGTYRDPERYDATIPAGVLVRGQDCRERHGRTGASNAPPNDSSRRSAVLATAASSNSAINATRPSASSGSTSARSRRGSVVPMSMPARPPNRPPNATPTSAPIQGDTPDSRMNANGNIVSRPPSTAMPRPPHSAPSRARVCDTGSLPSISRR
ncbi:MAG: sterol desaturase family protein [Deltaproteobacteria bacterium]|nr:sterol desaturase family protein [Deltaproteobacteria bacterium]MBK8713265.1 sterol desaturase family protein [Deltaproteobacteria bacterium]MBP7288942.1 sterol desaturase family protein [Nannocystaceae bacterium]